MTGVPHPVLCIGGPADGRVVRYSGEWFSVDTPGNYEGDARTHTVVRTTYQFKPIASPEGLGGLYLHGPLPPVVEAWDRVKQAGAWVPVRFLR